jgi:CheY-like chemotaxis protein
MTLRLQRDKSTRILLVEDNPLEIELPLDAFREARIADNIHVVRNGHDALDYLLGRHQYHDRQIYPVGADWLIHT